MWVVRYYNLAGGYWVEESFHSRQYAEKLHDFLFKSLAVSNLCIIDRPVELVQVAKDCETRLDSGEVRRP